MTSTLKGPLMDWRSYEETVKDIYATLGKVEGRRNRRMGCYLHD